MTTRAIAREAEGSARSLLLRVDAVPHGFALSGGRFHDCRHDYANNRDGKEYRHAPLRRCLCHGFKPSFGVGSCEIVYEFSRGVTRWGSVSNRPTLRLFIGCIEGGESLSIAHERFKQWSRCPVLAMLTAKFENTFVNLLKPNRVRVPHRAAAVGRKAVAGNVDRVDVCGALSESLGENARPFIDHDVDTSFDDFFIAYRPVGNAGSLRRRFDKRFDLRIPYRGPAIFISVPTGS